MLYKFRIVLSVVNSNSFSRKYCSSPVIIGYISLFKIGCNSCWIIGFISFLEID